MTIKAVVFDFDGTLMDTETCAYDAFCSIYAEFGQQLSLEKWAVGVGTYGGFDPYADLEQSIGRPLDHEDIKARFNTAHAVHLASATLRPGVLERLEEARSLGLSIGLASSSDRAWIERFLKQQGIRHYFEVIRSSDDVEKVKPDPALYVLACEALGVLANEAIAIEDSLNGLRAAKGAGMLALVVPNPITAHMVFSEADLVVESLADQSLEDIIMRLS